MKIFIIKIDINNFFYIKLLKYSKTKIYYSLLKKNKIKFKLRVF